MEGSKDSLVWKVAKTAYYDRQQRQHTMAGFKDSKSWQVVKTVYYGRW